MSELQTRFIDDTYAEYYNTGKHELAQVYLKSEADKEIAELKKACNDKDDWCLHTLKENRHQKYKRCLAMAEWCEERYNHLTCLENWQMTDKEFQQVIGDYWARWHDRWIKIAEKFKEAK